MNLTLLAAAILIILVGAVHSVLGEVLIFGSHAQRYTCPKDGKANSARATRTNTLAYLAYRHNIGIRICSGLFQASIPEAKSANFSVALNSIEAFRFAQGKNVVSFSWRDIERTEHVALACFNAPGELYDERFSKC